MRIKSEDILSWGQHGDQICLHKRVEPRNVLKKVRSVT